MLESKNGKFQAAGETELIEDTRQMMLDRSLTDVNCLADFLV